jgi:hypothetical protein
MIQALPVEKNIPASSKTIILMKMANAKYKTGNIHTYLRK